MSIAKLMAVLLLMGSCLNSEAVFAQDSASKTIRLIVRVDDMGCSHATNTGIQESYREGIATSVEVMVPTPWYPEAVAMLREMPDLDVGIHLTLTSEWTNLKWRPVTTAPSITDKRGYFYPMIWPNSKLAPGSALLEHDWDIREIERELRAQIEIARRDLPQLSHLSGHMGCLSINEEIKALAKKLAREYELDIFPEKFDLKRMPGLADNTLPPERRVQKFISILQGLTPGNWLFIEHPAHDLPEQQAIGHPGYEHVAHDRYGVLRMLTDERVKKVIEELGIELISYADLPKMR